MDGLALGTAFDALQVNFEAWTQNRSLPTLGTNSGAVRLPFQTWHHFKEAFAPELIQRAVDESPIPVRRLLDPFGGSGTSALATQFLGIDSTSIEVNPFLADVIAAKTTNYESGELVRDLGRIVRHTRAKQGDLKRYSTCPVTFIQPGKDARYIFSLDTAERLSCIQDAIERLENIRHQRLFRVLLGGILINVSNVRISGKGRRYRSGWQARQIAPKTVVEAFVESASRAITEIHTHAKRPQVETTVINDDSRIAVQNAAISDLVVFSPPYPNSFDYTDVYNLELWMLGYLGESNDNRKLRQSTLSSHVQIKRAFARAPQESPLLAQTLKGLESKREQLWNSWIPEMVGGYFADMGNILSGCAVRLNTGGQIWMVVGDSQYAGVPIAVDRILMELAPQWGLEPSSREPFRSMRASAQQGGREQLAETLVILAKA